MRTMAELTGIVFDIQRFSLNDGPGIRTTVFLKGCPLHCLWCHNPESQEPRPEISFNPERCIACGYCVRVCPHGCHVMRDGRHVFERANCERCGLCTRECHAQALELIGKRMSVAEVIAEVVKDRAFYQTSGGGITLSGGEPLAQPEFTRELLAAASAERVRTAIETCGVAPAERFREILPHLDLVLFDYKETDPAKAKEFTGADTRQVFENLLALDSAGKSIILRCPIVPGLNDREDHFAGIAAVAAKLKHLVQVDILPYHPLGESKSARFGKSYALAGKPFAEKQVSEQWAISLRKCVTVPVTVG